MHNGITLAHRLSEVLLNGKFIANTNLKEQLLATNWQQATTKISSLNTIALLTFHLNYYLDGILQVFHGGPLTIKDKYSFDMSPITNPEQWSNLVNTFIQNAGKFIDQVEQFTNEDLQATFADEKYGSYIKNIEGVIEHSYYHLGQVVIIRKMVVENEEKFNAGINP